MYDTTERVRRVKQTALRLIQKRERTAQAAMCWWVWRPLRPPLS